MREIKKRDEARQADITIFLNDDDEIIGIRIEPFKPIPIIDFNLDRLLRPQMIMRPPGFPQMPTSHAEAQLAAGLFGKFGKKV